MIKTKKAIINFSLVCGLISAIMFSMVGFSTSCEEMYDNIIRIRIIANSDTPEDQSLKLEIRDAVLEKSKELYSGTMCYDDALCVTEQNLDTLLETAQNAVYDNGFDYSVKAEVREEFFETREYDGFTLPAGSYKTAVFTVGEAEGKNWWCVIYPEVCVGACSARLNDAVSDKTASVAYKSDKYVVKFKTVEIFEKVKKYFDFAK